MEGGGKGEYLTTGHNQCLTLKGFFFTFNNFYLIFSYILALNFFFQTPLPDSPHLPTLDS